MQKVSVTAEDRLAVSYKAKHSLTIQSSNDAPRYFPNWFENLSPHQHLYSNVYNSIIHNPPKLETTKMSSIGKWINCDMPIQQ